MRLDIVSLRGGETYESRILLNDGCRAHAGLFRRPANFPHESTGSRILISRASGQLPCRRTRRLPSYEASVSAICASATVLDKPWPQPILVWNRIALDTLECSGHLRLAHT